MPLSPYISFAGNCAEATSFYQQVGGLPPPVIKLRSTLQTPATQT